MIINGESVSEGYGFGKIKKIDTQIDLMERSQRGRTVEVSKLEDAVSDVECDLRQISKNNIESAEIIEAHILMLNDPEFKSKIYENINAGYTAEYSVDLASRSIMDILLAIDDEYLRNRASDVKDVSDRIMYKIIGKSNELVLDENSIVVAEDLLPSQVASVNKTFIKGIITERGGRTSHTAILANIIGIPAITNVDIGGICNGSQVILDGTTGEIILEPTDEVNVAYEKKALVFGENKKKLDEYKNKPVVLSSGSIDTFINIGSVEDVEDFESTGANGVGLFRTEFMYMAENAAPSEEKQYQVYKSVLEKCCGNPVIIRTLDIGGDKDVPYLDFPDEENPFLGYRAVRYCLEHPKLFKTQIKAILRANVHGNAWMMIPMISTIDEIVKVKDLAEVCKKELEAEGIKYRDVKVGIMIETPAAAIKSDLLAKHVDFFSIGTNDLTQYTMAADRMNSQVKVIYDYFDPAVLRMIKMTIDAALNNGIEVGMCGEAAGDPLLIPLLLTMGLKEFSVSKSKISILKKTLLTKNTEKISSSLREILSLSSASEVKIQIEKLLN